MHNPVGFFLMALIVFIFIVAFWQDAGRGMTGLRYAFGFFILGFFGFWLFFFFRGKSWSFDATARSTWLTVLMLVLASVGLAGVLASALSAMGPLRLPSSREWPAGYVWGL